MQTIQLNNGVEMPVLGYGVFQVPPEEAERSPAKREKRPPYARHRWVII